MDDKQRMVDRLEGKGIPEMVKEYYELEDKISELLSEKENSGNECKCNKFDDDFEKIKFVHEGSSFDEVMTICLKCGGYIDG